MAMKVGGNSPDDELSPDIQAEINITPLTDVFLVLLIIFMVTTSVMSQMGVDVKLPKSSQATSSSESPKGVIITLLPDGSVKVNGVPISKSELPKMAELVKKSFEKTAEKLVILEGDQKAFLGSVVEVMDYAKKAGADRFAIATIPK